MSVTPDTRPPAEQSTGAASMLSYLALELHQARDQVSEAMRHPSGDQGVVRAARGRLLQALESYVAALAACRLPVPPAVRDDLRLQRCLLATGPTGRGSGRRRG